MTHPRSRSSRFLRNLRSALWQQPLYAIPFALFFGTLFGRGTWDSFLRAYQISLVFAFVIRIGIDAMAVFALSSLPRARASREGRFDWVEALGFAAASIGSAFVAGMIVHLTLLPGFLGSARSILVWAAFSVLFSVLFGGLAYARSYYRASLDRARQVERVRAQLAEAELRALRAQVHPHFLFNTLNTIAALVHENPAAAEETTTRLAEVFRYVLLASEREHARLADERAFVRDWLAIEQTRVGARLRVEEQVAPGLDDVAVPSLVLQPLIENAVRHAVASRDTGGTVRVSARADGDRLELAGSDDGPGFDDDAPPSGVGFGLHSVRERMRGAGAGHALAIDSEPGRGATVRLTLPLRSLSDTLKTGDPK